MSYTECGLFCFKTIALLIRATICNFTRALIMPMVNVC